MRERRERMRARAAGAGAGDLRGCGGFRGGGGCDGAAEDCGCEDGSAEQFHGVRARGAAGLGREVPLSVHPRSAPMASQEKLTLRFVHRGGGDHAVGGRAHRGQRERFLTFQRPQHRRISAERQNPRACEDGNEPARDERSDHHLDGPSPVTRAATCRTSSSELSKTAQSAFDSGAASPSTSSSWAPAANTPGDVAGRGGRLAGAASGRRSRRIRTSSVGSARGTVTRTGRLNDRGSPTVPVATA